MPLIQVAVAVVAANMKREENKTKNVSLRPICVIFSDKQYSFAKCKLIAPQIYYNICHRIYTHYIAIERMYKTAFDVLPGLLVQKTSNKTKQTTTL